MLVAVAGVLAAVGCHGSGQGGAEEVRFTVTSPHFQNEGQLPADLTCKGKNVAPTLNWVGTPEGTQSFVVIVDDPEDQSGNSAFWLVCDIPADATTVSSGVGVEGKNSSGKPGYGGPCPQNPNIDRIYRCRVIALGAMAGLPAGFTRKNLDDYLAKSADVLGRCETIAHSVPATE